MHLSDVNKQTLAKDFTELAIQNGLIHPCENAEEAAKEVTTFFKTIIDTIEDNVQ